MLDLRLLFSTGGGCVGGENGWLIGPRVIGLEHLGRHYISRVRVVSSWIINYTVVILNELYMALLHVFVQ